MYKIRILAVGKTKESWLDEALSEYLKRLKSQVQFEFIFVKDDKELLSFVENSTHAICLDEKGALKSSSEFSKFLLTKLQEGGSRLTLIIGGAEGLPPILKENCPLISLSPMTLTHQMVRLLLIEQIYRAFEIAKNSPYHK